MAKLTEIFLAVALLSLLHSTLQAQGRSVSFAVGEDAATQWRPLQNQTMAQQAHPDAVTLKYCDRCTCCTPVICQTFNCCMKSICAPSTGPPSKSKCDTKPTSCSCNTDTCR